MGPRLCLSVQKASAARGLGLVDEGVALVEGVS